MRRHHPLSAALLLATSVGGGLRFLRAADGRADRSLRPADRRAGGWHGRGVSRLPWLGFLGVWFFAILAPSSSVVPLFQQIAAEKRMYLPLAAVVTGVVVGGCLIGQRLVRSGIISLRASQLIGGVLALSAALALGTVAFRRNADYRSALSIWQDTVTWAPGNARAHNNLGLALADRGQADAAIAHYQKAFDIKPDYAAAHNNLGTALADRGQLDDAIAHLQKAMEIQPDYAWIQYNLGNALSLRGRFAEAIVHFQKAIEIQPDYAEAHNSLGLALTGRGQIDDAIVHFQKALEIKPDFADARRNRDLALARRKSILRGLAERRELDSVTPADTNLLNDTAWTLATNPNASVRDGAEAVALAQRAVKLSGGREPAILDTLAAAYAEAGRFADAVQTAQKAIDLATQQNRQTLAASIKARRQLYEAKTPFREPPSARSAPSH